MILADFPLVIDYAQVVVQAAGQEPAGLLWTEDHVAQGFAWSEGLVAFGVPDHDGESRIVVDLASAPLAAPDPQALWAVQVPFQLMGPLKIGAVFEMHDVAIPPGSYEITWQAFPGQDGYAFTLQLTFFPTSAPGFRILKPGGGITSNAVLRADAELSR